VYGLAVMLFHILFWFSEKPWISYHNASVHCTQHLYCRSGSCLCRAHRKFISTAKIFIHETIAPSPCFFRSSTVHKMHSFRLIDKLTKNMR